MIFIQIFIQARLLEGMRSGPVAKRLAHSAHKEWGCPPCSVVWQPISLDDNKLEHPVTVLINGVRHGRQVGSITAHLPTKLADELGVDEASISLIIA